MHIHYDGNYRDTEQPRLFQFLSIPSRLFHWTLVPLFRRYHKGAKILYYHEMRKEQFRNHVEYLTKHYEIVPLSSITDAIKNNEDLPEDAAAIVFDDGRRTIYSDVFPIVREHKIPITVYLVTEAIETGKYFWDKVNALEEANDSPGDVHELAKLRPSERQKLLNSELSDHDISFERTALNWDEINQMADYGVDFQCHTHTHPDLASQSREIIEREITKSKTMIENRLGKDVQHFSYPLGEVSDEVIEVLKETQFESAVGIMAGMNTTQTDLYRLHRFGVETASVPFLSSLMEGVWHTLTPGKQYRQ